MPVAPDPFALRRDRPGDPAWTRLTPRDPKATVPTFPLADPTPRELHWWAYCWALPQATEWENREEHVTVALYCRVITQTEAKNAPVTLHRPLKQLRDELGISLEGAHRRRWLMPNEGAAAKTAPATVTPINGRRARESSRPSAKDRFRRITSAEPFAHDTDTDTDTDVDSDVPPF